jgi:threonine/homoserine/homoserine lactone efflux protein
LERPEQKCWRALFLCNNAAGDAAMLSEYMPKLMLAWSIQLMGVISPGPSVMMILGVATSRGRGPAMTTAFGIACGSIILSTATALGVAVLFADIAVVMSVIRLVGAGYLFWLAYKAFGKAINPPPLSFGKAERGNIWKTAFSGFMLQISNPKAIFFWLAIASVGGIGDAPPLVIVLFVAVAFFNSFAGHGIYALLLSSAPVRNLLTRFRSGVESVLGCFFIFAGYKILTSKA